MHSKRVIFKLRFQFAESGRWGQKGKKKIFFFKNNYRGIPQQSSG